MLSLKLFAFRRALGALSVALALAAFFGTGAERASAASDLQAAASSPIAGIAFDDKPLALPVQRNFQMAMLTASSEIGQSCGRMESYGWRLDQTEQQRVNSIFNGVVDRLRAQGFSVEHKAPSAVSRDVTIFTANRSDKNLIFMWSAGDMGLAMLLCESTGPLSPPVAKVSPSMGTLQVPRGVSPVGEAAVASVTRSTDYAPVVRMNRVGKKVYEEFSPVGEWTGTYACSQGTTGATLRIDSVRGERFEGVFRFYALPKNPYAHSGSYAVYGEYDAESHRILINPGKWLKRPKDYYNTIIIGSFDPSASTFSAYFQGIVGCTSLEAKRTSYSASNPDAEKAASEAVNRIMSSDGDVLVAKKKGKAVKPKQKKKSSAAKKPVAGEKAAKPSSSPVGAMVSEPPKPPTSLK